MRDTGDMETEPAAADTSPARDFAPFLESVRSAPADGGVVELIVLRPARDERQLVAEVELDPARGVAGDNWSRSPTTASGGRSPATRSTSMRTCPWRTSRPARASPSGP